MRPEGGLRYHNWPIGPASAVLIGACVVVALLTSLGENREVARQLYITVFGGRDRVPALPEIMQGQVWRIASPMFLHFSVLHLVFNMLWLKDLGTGIEKVMGTGYFLLLVAVTGILANFGEFFFADPYFGGMSGVVYGLLGFVWMKSHFDPGSGFRLDQQTVWMMIGWFLLCAFGVVPNVANYAHGVGLAIGILWGFISAQRGRALRRRAGWPPSL